MAKNLQSKLPPSDSVRLFDINKDAMRQLSEEMRESQAGGAAVYLAESANDAAKEAVCNFFCLALFSFPVASNDEYVLSMI